MGRKIKEYGIRWTDECGNMHETTVQVKRIDKVKKWIDTMKNDGIIPSNVEPQTRKLDIPKGGIFG